MNFLAHLFLAGPDAESLLGNLAGDFVKGPLHDRYPPAMAAGITMHRKIDEFTDTHPAVAAFRRVVAAEQGHYARVICDVFFDYFLSCDWDDYTSESRDDFLRRVYRTLDPFVDEMPGRLHYVYPLMRDEGWLESYEEIHGIEMALRGLSRRFTRRVRLDAAVHFLRDARGALHLRFRQFFPDVIDYAKRIRSHS